MDVVWKSGQTILHQEVWRGRVWAARPLTVVEDTDEQLLAWIPQGTVRKAPVTPPRRVDPALRRDRHIENLDHGDWVYGDHVWDVSNLWVLRPGDWHAVWVSFDEAGRHIGWYVNFQQPYRRTSLGIEAMDLALDIVVEPDLSWGWKDDDEFEEILERRLFDTETGQRVREEAAAVVQRIEASVPPFCEPWTSWLPNPRWRRPELLPGWDDPAP